MASFQSLRVYTLSEMPTVSGILKLAAALLALSQAPAAGGPVVREERRVVINGQQEVWRLEWTTPPRPVCGPESAEWFTCPCSGFAFGESGKLDLVRLRQGREVERLPLAPFFDGGEWPADSGDALLRRWELLQSDWDHQPGPVPGVRSRPQASAMNFGDYDHDGEATEFYLQTNAGPCGHTGGIVVGVSRNAPRLHAFATAAHPDEPLFMDEPAWKALLRSQGPARMVVWSCGDHASGTETELEVSVASGVIHVTSREYQCDEHDKRGKLISQKPL